MANANDSASRLPRNHLASMVAMVWIIVLPMFTGRPVQAQTFTVLYNFTGGADGGSPYAGLSIDAAGNLYGTTYYGGNGTGTAGSGTVFKLAHKNSGWILTPLYSFAGGSDGANPYGGVVFGPNGSLYGTTYADPRCSQNGDSCGTVFSLRPPATTCTSALCPWTETVIHRFAGGTDGSNPTGNVTFDEAGDLYGSTTGGYSVYNANSGTVYEFVPSQGGWAESVLYDFRNCGDLCGTPWGPVILDSSGNLYGATPDGGDGACFRLGAPCGTVFELTRESFRWVEKTLFSFGGGGEGGYPLTGVIRDNSGNLYGASSFCGLNGGGAVFMLSSSGGSWRFNVVYGLSGSCVPPQSYGPYAPLTMDANGNLYGTTLSDAAGVFKLTPSNGGWSYTNLHTFCLSGPPCSDGDGLMSTVVMDASGHLYGTTSQGGALGYGVVWEITP